MDWQAVVNTVGNLGVRWNAGNFSTNWRSISFLRMTVLSGVGWRMLRLCEVCSFHGCVSSGCKEEESRNRPGVTQRVPGGLGSQISMTFGKWRWWCQPHAPAAFTPRRCSWYSFSLRAESTPGPWYSRKEYVTEKSSDTTGIDPAIFRLVAQRLNFYCTPGPFFWMWCHAFWWISADILEECAGCFLGLLWSLWR
jgi:hypothetical protein